MSDHDDAYEQFARRLFGVSDAEEQITNETWHAAHILFGVPKPEQENRDDVPRI